MEPKPQPRSSANVMGSGMGKVIRDEIRALTAYPASAVPPDAIKLDAMENPFTLPDAARAELGRRLAAVPVNRYPDDHASLRAALKLFSGFAPGVELLLGNGSDEIIQMLALCCAKRGAVMMAPAPSFVMYQYAARIAAMDFVAVDLTEQFALDESAWARANERWQPALTFLALPNNPTANLFDAAVLGRIIDAAPGLVVLDEAYWPFAERTHESWLTEPRWAHKLLLLRTLSKFGLAGARIGYLAGHAELIAEINKVRAPYNISRLDAECALFALEHAYLFTKQANRLLAERQWLLRSLAALPGVSVFPSQANMILFRLPRAREIVEALRARSILVKDVSHTHPLLANCLRVTVGAPEENHRFLAALAAMLAPQPH